MSFIANKGMRATNKENYQTSEKDKEKKVTVDGKVYTVLLPSGNQSTAFGNCQKPDKFGPVYDKLRETHSDKLKGGLKFPELPMLDGDDDKLAPHIRAIRQAFVDTGRGWGSGPGCKFWYDNLYYSHDYDLYRKQMYLNIRPEAGHIVRAKAGKKAACEEPPAEKVAAEAPAEKEAPAAGAEKVSSQKAPSVPKISVEFIMHEKEYYAMEKGVNRIFFFDDWKKHNRTPETHYPTQIAHIEGDGIPPSGQKMETAEGRRISVIDGEKQRGFEFPDESGYHMIGGMFIYPIKEKYKLVITKSKKDFEQEIRAVKYKTFLDSLTETKRNEKTIYYEPYNEKYKHFELWKEMEDDNGDLAWTNIGHYNSRNADNKPIDDDDHKYDWSIQYHGFDPDSSDEENSDQESHQEIPKDWQEGWSKTHNHKYWYDSNNPTDTTWIEPPEVKEDREQQEKWDLEWDAKQKQKEDDEIAAKKKEEEIKNRPKLNRDRLRARAAAARNAEAARKAPPAAGADEKIKAPPAAGAEPENRGPCVKCGKLVFTSQARTKTPDGKYYHDECLPNKQKGGRKTKRNRKNKTTIKRKTRRRKNAGSGKGIKSTTKKEVSWPDQLTYAKRFPRMTPTLLEKGLARAAPSIKKGPTPSEPWDIENQYSRTPIKSAIKNNKGTTPLQPIEEKKLPRPHGLGGRKRTKRRNNKQRKRTIKRKR